jgi:hypothetical protein
MKEQKQQIPISRIEVYLLCLVACLSCIAIIMGIPYIQELFGTEPSKNINSNFDNDEINSVWIKKEPMDLLNIWYDSYDVEFVACMKVSDYLLDNKSVYYLDSLSSTKIYEQSDSNVEFDACVGDSIADVHNHPGSVCKMSNDDSFHFGKNVNLKLLCIICGEDEITCWDRELNEYEVKVSV